MPRYYLDIETCPLPEFWDADNPNNKSIIADPSKNKIITIQFQPIAYDTGKPTDELTILKEWESSEEEIVKEFAKKFVPCDTDHNLDVWKFVPVGNNLDFEMIHLLPKLEKYCNIELDTFGKPTIDVKPILITVNEGKFTGYSLVLGKNGKASNIASWYYSKDYDSILDYIVEETENFLEGYQLLCYKLPMLKRNLESLGHAPTGLDDLR